MKTMTLSGWATSMLAAMAGLLAFQGTARSEVIFADDFEDDPSDWVCGDGGLSKWSDGYGACGQTAGFGYHWRMGPGRNGGNAVQAWKHQSVPNGYHSESDRWLAGADLRTEVYHRWYMKWPSEVDKDAAEGFKLWRYILRENGFSGPPEIYLNVRGNPISQGDLVIYCGGTGYLSLVPVADFNDGSWHAHELRIKLNSNGQSDGTVQFWLDGVVRATHSNLSFGSEPDLKIHRFGVGIGNVSDSPWFMTEWTAVSFDDVVLGTEYVGPDGSAGADAGLAPGADASVAGPDAGPSPGRDAGPADVGAGGPGTVGDLAAAATGSSSATLAFTEVGDGEGGPASYEVRYALAPLGWGWGTATDVTSGTCAAPMAGTAVGAGRTCTVQDLSPETAYDFQLVAFRGVLQVDAVFGELSNVASATTLAPQVAADAGASSIDGGATCTPGAACVSPEPCRFGAIACAAGEPVCEAGGALADGTACPGGSCHAGRCEPLTLADAGTACGVGTHLDPSSGRCEADAALPDAGSAARVEVGCGCAAVPGTSAPLLLLLAGALGLGLVRRRAERRQGPLTSPPPGCLLASGRRRRPTVRIAPAPRRA